MIHPTAKGIGQAFLYGSATVCLVSVASLAIHLQRSIDTQSEGIANAIHWANKDLVDAHDVLVHADMAVNDTRKASDLELKALPQMTDQVQTTLASVNGAVASVQATSDNASDQLTRIGEATASTLEASRVTIAGLQPVEANASSVLVAAQKSAADLDALVKSPAIPETLGNVQSVTASGARIAADAAFEADKLAHPPKKALTFWGAVEGTVLWIHRLEPPIF